MPNSVTNRQIFFILFLTIAPYSTLSISKVLAESAGTGAWFTIIITSIIFDKVKGAFKQIQAHSRTISIVSGALLIIAGILVFTGSLKYLNFFGLYK
jgi:cytochrome c-type biogenesis protein